ncbi:zinc finger protein 518B [Rhinoderma darwinii]|uniref:zinc finger protein 518B n=1 Tax=Rhinoderma darwinii TaxID=43563 RepID=UPI003F66A3EC
MMNSMLQKQMLEKFNCEKCRFSTKDPNKYKNHVSLHNDIKYACSHCDFVSYTKTEFQRHLVTHTGKFPYTCGYCGYGAIRNDYIVKHIRRIHGDGKIQCSVSTVENESMKASINIMQTQVTAPNVQNILQNNPSLLTEDVIDLTTEVDSLGSSNNILVANGNNVPGQVEVEVISPADQQLYPWIPLTVVAPTSFRVPPNCIAQVVEVKPVNSACHLVLKCMNWFESSEPNRPVKTEPISGKKSSNPDIQSKSITENPVGPSSQECTVLRKDCKENTLNPSNSVGSTKENLHTNVTGSIDKTNEIINAIHDIAKDMFDDLEEFSGGPIISSVFSLSSDSQNTIEGIQWECPFISPNKSPENDIDATHSSLNPPASQEGTTTFDLALNQPMDIDESQKTVEKTVLQSEKESSEIKMDDLKQSTNPEIQLPLKSVPTDDQKIGSQPSVDHLKIRKVGRISDRLGKIETNNFIKPQKLFLSCDKRIVMQPLSCTMQNTNMTASQVGKVMEQLQALVKTRKEKVKRLVAPSVKSRAQPHLQTLRLQPVKVDQGTHLPRYNQPVVVLNHPDLESMETSHIMKSIRVFKGNITKITLSKQVCKKSV